MKSVTLFINSWITKIFNTKYEHMNSIYRNTALHNSLIRSRFVYLARKFSNFFPFYYVRWVTYPARRTESSWDAYKYSTRDKERKIRTGRTREMSKKYLILYNILELWWVDYNVRLFHSPDSQCFEQRFRKMLISFRFPFWNCLTLFPCIHSLCIYKRYG